MLQKRSRAGDRIERLHTTSIFLLSYCENINTYFFTFSHIFFIFFCLASPSHILYCTCIFCVELFSMTLVEIGCMTYVLLPPPIKPLFYENESFVFSFCFACSFESL